MQQILNQLPSLRDAKDYGSKGGSASPADIAYLKTQGFDDKSGFQDYLDQAFKNFQSEHPISPVQEQRNEQSAYRKNQVESERAYRQFLEGSGVETERRLQRIEQQYRDDYRKNEEAQTLVGGQYNPDYDSYLTELAKDKYGSANSDELFRSIGDYLRQGYKLSEINPMTGKPYDSTQPISEYERTNNLRLWETQLGLSARQVHDSKDVFIRRYLGYRPDEIRPFIPGFDDIDTMQKRLKDENPKLYEAKYGHQLPGRPDTASRIAIDPMINSTAFAALKGFYHTTTLGLEALLYH